MRKATIRFDISDWLSLWPSVLMERFGSHRTEFHEIGNLIIFRKSVEKIQDSLKFDKGNGYFTRRYTFMIVSRSVLLKMRNFSYNLCRENQNAHFMFIFFFENLVVYEITWKYTVQPNRPQTTILCVRVAWWIPKAKNTPPEYVLLTSFPLQQCFH
jgi:hypothetical protein